MTPEEEAKKAQALTKATKPNNKSSASTTASAKSTSKSVGSKSGASSSSKSHSKPDLNFTYQRGINKDKVLELRKLVRRHEAKISRQAKIIERLKKLRRDKVQNLPVEQIAKLSKQYLPGFAGTFFEAQLSTMRQDNRKHGHRWDDDTKIFALGLWNRSPAAFKLMQKAFNMPSIKTLTNWVLTVPPEVDFFQKLREVLTKAIEYDDDVENKERKPRIRKVEPQKGLARSHQIIQEAMRRSEAQQLQQQQQQQQQQQHHHHHIPDGEVEPDESHDEEAKFPDEEPMEVMEDDSGANKTDDERAIIEKVCFDLDTGSAMRIVEEVVTF